MSHTEKEQSSKDRIYLTALNLFARKGFTATGLRELAKKSEVNLAMINYFFNSKKELLIEIIDSFLGRYLTIAEEELTGPANLPVKIKSFVYRSIEFFDAEQESLVITISELPHDDPEISKHKASWAKQMLAIIDTNISRPNEKTSGKYIPPTCLAPIFTSLMSSRFLFSPVMDKTKNNKQVIPLAEYKEMIVSLLLHGLLTKK